MLCGEKESLNSGHIAGNGKSLDFDRYPIRESLLLNEPHRHRDVIISLVEGLTLAGTMNRPSSVVASLDSSGAP